MQSICKLIRNFIPSQVEVLDEPSLHTVFGEAVKHQKCSEDITLISSDCKVKLFTDLFLFAERKLEILLQVTNSSGAGSSVVGERRWKIMSDLYLDFALYILDMKEAVIEAHED